MSPRRSSVDGAPRSSAGSATFARGGPAARRGRDPRRLVERQLQGRARDAGRRQGRPDQPAHPGHRPGRRGGRQRRPGDRRRDARSWPTATTSASSRHGGYAEYQRVPAGWVVPLAPGPDAARRDGHRDGRVHGGDVRRGAGGARPAPGDGPVLVTGASGGVGGTALAILAERGYEVWAATGKPDEAERLTGLGRGRHPDPRRGRPPRASRSSRSAGPAPWTRWAARRCRTSCGRSRPGGGRGQRQRRRPEARHDGLPVHPARRRAARDGLGHRADRAPTRASGTGWPRTCGRASSGEHVTEVDLDGLEWRSTASSPARPGADGSCASAATEA